MKKRSDPRHVERIHLIQNLFAKSFGGKPTNTKSDLPKIIELLPQIDQDIEKSAPQFPIEKISRIDVAILRLAIYELHYKKNAPAKVIIDEAVESAKELGNEGSPAFINGVLGTLFKEM